MLQNKFTLIIAAALALALAGCGGGGAQTSRIQFSSQVVFGDSLSDVGSYAGGLITSVGHGGLFTVNPKVRSGPVNWTEYIARDLNLPAPCAAQTGLNGTAFAFTITSHPECTNYAQGGARVTNALGVGNKNLPTALGGSAALGQLTTPIKTQIERHVAGLPDNKFSGSEIVFVLAGGNDAIINTLTYVGTIIQSGCLVTSCTAVAAAAEATAVQAMTTAATELAGYINNQLVGNGANYVFVQNVPVLDLTPFGVASENLIKNQTGIAFPGTQAVVKKLVNTFNSQLAASIISSPKVLLADLNTASAKQVANPAEFGLTNVTTPVCTVANNILNGSSLVCNLTDNNVIAGDISTYAFADTVHPTPFGYFLIAAFVAQNLGAAGWLVQ